MNKLFRMLPTLLLASACSGSTGGLESQKITSSGAVLRAGSFRMTVPPNTTRLTYVTLIKSVQGTAEKIRAMPQAKDAVLINSSTFSEIYELTIDPYNFNRNVNVLISNQISNISRGSIANELFIVNRSSGEFTLIGSSDRPLVEGILGRVTNQKIETKQYYIFSVAVPKTNYAKHCKSKNMTYTDVIRSCVKLP